jgi:hypothetical protein
MRWRTPLEQTSVTLISRPWSTEFIEVCTSSHRYPPPKAWSDLCRLASVTQLNFCATWELLSSHPTVQIPTFHACVQNANDCARNRKKISSHLLATRPSTLFAMQMERLPRNIALSQPEQPESGFFHVTVLHRRSGVRQNTLLSRPCVRRWPRTRRCQMKRRR